MLDNIFGELLKHRRILIEKLDNESPIVINAIKAELQKTDVITDEIKKVVDDLKKKLLGN